MTEQLHNTLEERQALSLTVVCPEYEILFQSIQFSRSVVSNSLQSRGLHVACQASLSITNFWSLLKLMSIESVIPSNLSSSAVPFSSHLQSFPASGSFQMSQFLASGGQSIGVSASATDLVMNIQD